MKLKPFPFWAMKGNQSATPPQPKRYSRKGTLASRVLRGIPAMRRKRLGATYSMSSGNLSNIP